MSRPRFPTTQRTPTTPIDARVDVAIDYHHHIFNQQDFQFADPAVARDQANEVFARRAMLLADILVDDETSRSWLVTLGAIELLTPNDSGAPPCIIFGAPDGSPMSTDGDQFPLRALVEWGTAGAAHSAYVDWPVKGSSFVVHGSQVRIQSAFPPSVFSPDVGGGSIHKGRLVASVVPCSATRPARETPRATVFYGSMLGAPTDIRTQPIPAHAIACRPIFTSQWTPGTGFQLYQFIDSGLARRVAWTQTLVANPNILDPSGGAIGSANAWAPGGWWTVHALAQFMTVQADTDAESIVAVEYMLDVG